MSVDAPAPQFEPHNRVGGKFRLRKRLAVGGMGEVWVARNESTGADVALKVLRRGDARRAAELQAEERFRNEARISAMLAHRSVVKVFDLLEEPGQTLILVMELLRGETLQEYVEREGPRPAREAVAIVSPILGALAHAHERGIIHRDVTPANIFLAVDPDGRVTPKLVDFGIAKVSGAAPSIPPQANPIETLDGRVLGTPRYMAPERIRATADVDGRSDVFSVAVVLYETMTGISPFAGSNPSASLAAVLERPVEADSRIEAPIWTELARAMSKRPGDRHATAHELATALAAALGESDGVLEASLRREPPLSWEDDVLALAPVRPEGAQTIEGQSVAVVPPRRRKTSVRWIATAGSGSRGLHRARGHTEAARRRGVYGRARGSRVSPSATGASTPVPAASVERLSGTASAVVLTPSAMPVMISTTPGMESSRIRPASKPRPIATTPGF